MVSTRKKAKPPARSLAAEYFRIPEDILLGNRCPIHPKAAGERSRKEALSRQHERLAFCQRCRRWYDFVELAHVALGPAGTVEGAVRACHHLDTPAPVLAGETRWRERRARLLERWPDARSGAATFERRSQKQLPFGDFGWFDRAEFMELFPDFIPGVGFERRTLGSRSNFFLARLLRDEFLRPVALEAYRPVRERLVSIETARFSPLETRSLEVAFAGADREPGTDAAETLLCTGAALAGRVALGLAGWSERTPVGFVRRFAAPAPGASRRYVLVGEGRAVLEPLGGLLESSGAEVALVADPPDGALRDSRTFRALQVPFVRAPAADAPRELRQGGRTYRRQAGAYWRDDERISDFVLGRRRSVRRRDGSLLHELTLVHRDAPGDPAVFTVASADFHRGIRLYVTAIDVAIAHGLPAPVLATPALKQLLPALVLALEPAPPLVEERPAVLDALLSTNPPVQTTRGRRLVAADYLHSPGVNVDPDELSRALRQHYGPEYGLVRTGRYKQNKAIRIP